MGARKKKKKKQQAARGKSPSKAKASPRTAKVRKASRPKKARPRVPDEDVVYSDVRRELQSSLLRRLR